MLSTNLKSNKLNEEERRGLVYIRDSKEVTKSQYASHYNYNDKKAQRHLTKMRELGLVKQLGKGKSIKYAFSGDQ